MTMDEFKEKVLEVLQTTYAPHKTDEELKEAMKEYDDIIRDGFECHCDGPRGVQHGIEYAADNISMCI